MNAIRNSVRILREERGMSQQQLADYLTDNVQRYSDSENKIMKKDTISRWENEIQPIPSDVILALSELFNQSCHYILTGKDYNNADQDIEKHEKSNKVKKCTYKYMNEILEIINK